MQVYGNVDYTHLRLTIVVSRLVLKEYIALGWVEIPTSVLDPIIAEDVWIKWTHDPLKNPPIYP